VRIGVVLPHGDTLKAIFWLAVMVLLNRWTGGVFDRVTEELEKRFPRT